MTNNIIRITKLFIPLALITTITMGALYFVAQQNLRTNANDPQIQIAEDLSAQLADGRTTIAYINTIAPVDISKTLSPFVFVYDDAGKMLAGTGKLAGENPSLPEGVLEATKKTGQDRITWQPQKDLRVALVIVRYEGDSSGFVAVGRSLREVEQRESVLGWQVLVLWIVGLVMILGMIIAGKIILYRPKIIQ